MEINIEAEKQWAKKALEDGEFDIDILDNNELDYRKIQNDDIAAFAKHLKSQASKSLSSKVFG